MFHFSHSSGFFLLCFIGMLKTKNLFLLRDWLKRLEKCDKLLVWQTFLTDLSTKNFQNIGDI